MNALARVIAEEIEESGPIPVGRFMELALAHPAHGYYRTRDPLGRQGDFITAPEVSQMFGELLGLWAVVMWERLGAPDPVVLAELGPGRGTLMADALRAASIRPEFVKALRLHLVETSPVLTEHQKEALAAYGPTVHADVADLPPGPMIVIANEFFDALPIRQLVATGPGWSERRVALGPGSGPAFAFTDGPLAGPFQPPDGLGHPVPQGAVFELCPAARSIVGGLATRAAAAPTAVLIIDYGHGRSALGETLQAVRGHEYTDPLAHPGGADLTAHVDFDALATAARAGGAAVHGPIGQGRFLLALGIQARAERLAAGAEPEAARGIDADLRRLVSPEEMGTLFKAMALTSPGAGVPPGFEPPGNAAP
ncbi:MAG: SAM-dependent methyltransferase [Alphaproteobacteria bacterium]|nr:SAM-dependent methyltransferase [Alphaproteobacteria bacterium]